MRYITRATAALLTLAVSLGALSACGGSDAGTSSHAKGWPVSQPGESPPPAPAEVEAVIGNLDALAAMLPADAVSRLFDPLALGVTVRDLSDPELVAFQVRATLAQLQDGSRLEQVYHRYGHPDFNDQVALVPVHFSNRYGTPLYGEIVLPYRGSRPPSDGPYPVILALEGLNTNVGMYRWWHQVFADAGYLVFAFDFSGQGQSDDEVSGDPGNNVEDAIDALDWLLTSSPVVDALDADHIGVIGHSMGAITTLALQAVEPRLKAAVAAAPISEAQAPFDANPIPVMIQTGDHDGPIAPIPFVNPAVVRPIYEKLNPDRAFIVAEASSHAQHTNYPLLPTSTWGHEIAAQYSLAWMDLHLRGDTAAIQTLRTAHPHLSYLWDSEVDVAGEITVLRGAGPGQ
ncbi:alpha/beta fold hydrolase [Sinimarinibacterium sp. CAU 1509]|uniref:alpha/beta hydrolase family protein n=1 Tax=Sinimarinibacterium sp. CAU 1509 TaxID=2562283 RepID=UPI0010AB7DEF|nr:alpha/beta fold hydrolase [Sinimarinibacterium sp. CAU 1509]TJY61929.1 alpha/beta fold hydrolase [Sinimarinibacterium sp. CAU 1509]